MSKFHLTVQVLAGAVLLMAAIQADRTMNLPVSMTGLALALWLFFLWQSTDAFRTHLFMMALLMVLISLLPLAGMTSLSKLFIPGHGGYELAVSLLLIVGGICDHLILMRAFAHTERAHHDQTI